MPRTIWYFRKRFIALKALITQESIGLTEELLTEELLTEGLLTEELLTEELLTEEQELMNKIPAKIPAKIL